mgnify:CR=1 FL=1
MNYEKVYKIKDVIYDTGHGTLNEIKMNELEVQRYLRGFYIAGINFENSFQEMLDMKRISEERKDNPVFPKKKPGRNYNNNAPLLMTTGSNIFKHASIQGFEFKIVSGCEGFQRSCKNSIPSDKLFCDECKENFEQHYYDGKGDCNNCAYGPCLYWKTACKAYNKNK